MEMSIIVMNDAWTEIHDALIAPKMSIIFVSLSENKQEFWLLNCQVKGKLIILKFCIFSFLNLFQVLDTKREHFTSTIEIN